MSNGTPKKKKSLLKRWFSVSDESSYASEKPNKDKGHRKSLTVQPEISVSKTKAQTLPTIQTEDTGGATAKKPAVADQSSVAAKSGQSNSLQKPDISKSMSGTSLSSRGSKDGKRKKKNRKQIDVSKIHVTGALDWPTTPEMILAHHKHKPMLKPEEEWMLMELNEYECLVESMDILKQMSKVSKFFEVDPDELWEEFFEFVEEIPAYDDMLTSDILQEFKDQCYPQ